MGFDIALFQDRCIFSVFLSFVQKICPSSICNRLLKRKLSRDFAHEQIDLDLIQFQTRSFSLLRKRKMKTPCYSGPFNKLKLKLPPFFVSMDCQRFQFYCHVCFCLRLIAVRETRAFYGRDASRSLREDIEMLESRKVEILEEYRQVKDLSTGWERNRTSSGSWNTFYLVNQVSYPLKRFTVNSR